MMPSVVILAGGIATRLRPITEKIPKAMLTIAGEPFIAHQLHLLKNNGVSKIMICAGYLGHQIEEFVGDGSKFGLSVQYSLDGEKLLGTGGAIKKALPLLEEEFFVMYGDSYLTVNFKDVYDSFQANSKLGLMTIYQNLDAWDKSNVVFKDGQIVVYDKKKKAEGMDYIDYGLGLLKKEAFKAMADQEIFDLSEVYQDLILKKQLSGYVASERFYEIGSHHGLEETEKYILVKKIDTVKGEGR